MRLKPSVIIGSLAAIAVVVVAVCLFFSSRGQTVTSGTYPAPVTTDSISCEAAFPYPLFEKTDALESSLKVNAAFNKDGVESISIISVLTYNSKEEAVLSRDENRAAINRAFAAENLEADALGAVYSENANAFRFSLYANSKDLTATASKFFLLDGLKNLNLDAMKTHYVNMGFSCAEKH